MSTAAKVILGILGVTGITMLVIKGKDLLSKFDFAIAGYGMPKLSNWVLSLPIRIQFKNPTPLSITADSVIADIYIYTGSNYKFVGNVNQPLSIPVGNSESVITPNVELKKLFGGNIMSMAQSILSTKLLKVRTNVTVTYKGITLPTQTFDNDVPIS